MAQLAGWAGTILHVDLSKSEIKKIPTDIEMAKKFLGGDGLGSKLLWDYLPPNTDPLSPDNVFILSTGPLTGTLAPASGRLSVVYKSPVTGLIGASNSGGFFAPEMKWAGYDSIVITGKAAKPVWLWINDDKVEIRDASDLWGKETWDTIDAMEATTGEPTISTMVIGPAGENLVSFALPLVNRTRAPGKGGGGAVMGSKNLKGIAVKGSKGVRIANPKKFADYAFNLRQTMQSAPGFDDFSRIGVPMVYQFFEEVQGVLPTKNFQEGVFPEGRKALSIDTLLTEFEDRKSEGCFGCPCQCGHQLSIKSGKYKGVNIEGIEYYAQYVFGPNLGVADWGFVIKCHELCAKLGLGYSVGAVLGWVSELYEKGLVTKQQMDNLDLSWGNEESYIELIHKIAYRQGIGDILANNWTKAADQLGPGTEDYQPVITRLDATECPRSRMDVALSHLISNRGGDHNKAMPGWNWMTPPEFTRDLMPDLKANLEETVDMYSPVGKVELVHHSQKMHALLDSSAVCMFTSLAILAIGGWSLQDLANHINAATGVEYDGKTLLDIGERIAVLQRAFNVREGADRSLYKWAKKFSDTAPTQGLQAGIKPDMKIVNKMVDDYLVDQGFDPKTGYPTEEKLVSMGLGFTLPQLKGMGRIISNSPDKNKGQAEEKKQLEEKK